MSQRGTLNSQCIEVLWQLYIHASSMCASMGTRFATKRSPLLARTSCFHSSPLFFFRDQVPDRKLKR